jgi:hypothetical protein
LVTVRQSGTVVAVVVGATTQQASMSNEIPDSRHEQFVELGRRTSLGKAVALKVC